MYTNGIPNCSKFDITLFADDTYSMLSGTNLKELEFKVNEELKNRMYGFVAINYLLIA